MPNQVTRRLGHLLLLRENAETPSDAEWDETLKLLTEDPEELPLVKVLVVTDGGGPTTDQRKKLDRALGGAPVRIAVVSESAKVRFIVSSVALLASHIQSFRISEISGAFAHLSLSREERRLAERNIREMSELVGSKTSI